MVNLIKIFGGDFYISFAPKRVKAPHTQYLLKKYRNLLHIVKDIISYLGYYFVTIGNQPFYITLNSFAMKKIILSCAAALLAIGSAHATPKFLSLNNKHGKTTIKIEIPASDRDETNGLSIEDVVLYNDGKTFQAKKVDAIWGDNSTVILQFEKLTAFEDCTLSFSLNGEPVSLDIQSCLADRK